MAEKKLTKKEIEELQLAAGPLGWQRILGALAKVEKIEGRTGGGITDPLITKILGKDWITKVPEGTSSRAMEQMARDLIGGKIARSLGFDVPQRKVVRFDPKTIPEFEGVINRLESQGLRNLNRQKARTALAVEKVPSASHFDATDYSTSKFPFPSSEAKQVDENLMRMWPSDYWLGNTDRRQYVMNTDPKATLQEQLRVRPIDFGLMASPESAALAIRGGYKPEFDWRMRQPYNDFGGVPRRYSGGLRSLSGPPDIPAPLGRSLLSEADKIANYPRKQLEDIVYRTPQSWVTYGGKQTNKEVANDLLSALVDYLDVRAKTVPEHVRRFLAGETRPTTKGK